jgi:predicted nucleic acid-binding protein
MAASPRVLIDLNVILDVLQRREPHFAASAQVLACAETGRIEAYVAAHSLTTLFYLVAKDRSADQARVILGDLLRFLTVASIDHQSIKAALELPYSDFDDAVQMVAATQIRAQYLITRDAVGFKAGPLRALQPAELLALL